MAVDVFTAILEVSRANVLIAQCTPDVDRVLVVCSFAGVKTSPVAVCVLGHAMVSVLIMRIKHMYVYI